MLRRKEVLGHWHEAVPPWCGTHSGLKSCHFYSPSPTRPRERTILIPPLHCGIDFDGRAFRLPPIASWYPAGGGPGSPVGFGRRGRRRGRCSWSSHWSSVLSVLVIAIGTARRRRRRAAHGHRDHAVDDINPALPIIRNIP